jgi:hypothetical protein
MDNFSADYGTVVYEGDQNLVIIRSKGYISQENLIAIADYGYKMILFHKVNSCLIDMLEMKIYPFGFEEYLRNVWYSKIRNAGISRIAFVVPEDIFGQISMENVHKGSADVKKIERQYFKNELEAHAWLSSVPAAEVV